MDSTQTKFDAAVAAKRALVVAMIPKFRAALATMAGSAIGGPETREPVLWKEWLKQLGWFMDGQGEQRHIYNIEPLGDVVHCDGAAYAEIVSKIDGHGLHILEERLRYALSRIRFAGMQAGVP